jgi:hypothetical protein
MTDDDFTPPDLTNACMCDVTEITPGVWQCEYDGLVAVGSNSFEAVSKVFAMAAERHEAELALDDACDRARKDVN